MIQMEYSKTWQWFLEVPHQRYYVIKCIFYDTLWAYKHYLKIIKRNFFIAKFHKKKVLVSGKLTTKEEVFFSNAAPKVAELN